MTGKTGVLAVLVAAFFCTCVSAAANEVQGLVPTRDGGRTHTTDTFWPPGSFQKDLPASQVQTRDVLIERTHIDGTDGVVLAVTCDHAGRTAVGAKPLEPRDVD